MSRLNIPSGAKWEDVVGYSRAVRIGNIIEVSGTVSIKDGVAWAEGDAYSETKRILEIIRESIEKAGGKMEDVIRTRTYITDAKLWPQVAKAHSEVFNAIRPATSMVEVSALISPEYQVEIEASAIIED